MTRALPTSWLAGLLLLACAHRPTTAILVRHAEVDHSTGDRDPPLTDAGRARADALATYAAREHVAAVYSTDYQRTRQTAEPTIAALDVPGHERLAGDLDGTAAHVREHYAGRTVLLVGHSNTVPALVHLLGVEAEVRPIDEAEYDRVFTVEITKDGATLTESTY